MSRKTWLIFQSSSSDKEEVVVAGVGRWGKFFIKSINLYNHTCFNSVNTFSVFICTTVVISTGRQIFTYGPLKMSIVPEMDFWASQSWGTLAVFNFSDDASFLRYLYIPFFLFSRSWICIKFSGIFPEFPKSQILWSIHWIYCWLLLLIVNIYFFYKNFFRLIQK